MNGKKTVCILMAAAMLAASALGCAGAPEENGSQTEESSQASGAVQDTAEGGEIDFYKKYDPPITLTQGMVCPDDIFPEGQSIDNNAYTEWCKNEAGIIWKSKWVAPDSETNTQKINLAIASNDLPDVMNVDKSIVSKLAKGGQILRLDDYLETYTSDLNKFIVQEAQEAENGMYYVPFKYQGGIYGVPTYAHTVDPEYNWYRKDILESLGLKAPATVEELEQVLAAVKEKYPNMTGLMLEKGTGKAGTSAMVMDAYGSFPTIWQEKNGKLEYGAIQPETKAALAKLRDWYQAGYLDKEFVVADADAKWAAGDVFARSSMWHLNWGANLQLIQNVPEANLSVFEYLKGEGGFQGRVMTSGISASAFVINSKCENPEAFFILGNYYTDSAYRNMEDLREKFDFHYDPEPVQLAKNQAEYEQLVADGVNIDKAMATRIYEYQEQGPDQGDTEGFLNQYVNHGYRQGFKVYQRATALRDGFQEAFSLMKEGGDKEALSDYARILYDQSYDAWGEMLCLAEHEGAEAAESLRDTEVRDLFLGAPTPTMVEKKAYLDKIQDEAFVKIIMGEAPVDSFDTFVADWKANGGDAITKEVNQWYEENKSE